MAPGPRPSLEKGKIPGAVEARFTVRGELATPSALTSTLAVERPANSQGTCTFSCRGDVENKGAATPSKVTQTPPSTVGRGSALAAAVLALRLVPKIEAIEPGATGDGAGAKLAALTTPPEFIWRPEEG